jgi:hypothetical protein
MAKFLKNVEMGLRVKERNFLLFVCVAKLVLTEFVTLFTHAVKRDMNLSDKSKTSF